MDGMGAARSTIGPVRDGAQLLTFALDGKEYGLDILKVQEIRRYSPVTPIPNMPGYLKGVMSLRGTILPVIDLRVKLGVHEAEDTSFAIVIVVRVGAHVAGVMVDGVSDVLAIAADTIQPAPDFGAAGDVRFITGIAKFGERLVVLLDIDRVLGATA